MPNVAGREFPYTPQGMRDAEMYRQSLGMQDAETYGQSMLLRPMDFRPLGYADAPPALKAAWDAVLPGGSPEAGGAVGMTNSDIKQLILDLYQRKEVPEEALRIAAKDTWTAEETALLQSYIARAVQEDATYNRRGTMPGMPMEPMPSMPIGPMGPMGPMETMPGMPGTTVVEGQFEEETGRPITEKRYDAQSYGGGPPGMAYGGIMGLSRKGR